jgi:hypothetical protein
MRKFLIRTCVWALGRLTTVPKSDPEPREVQLKMLANLYATQAVREYLTQQEAYLMRMAADALVEGKIPDSKFLAGRLKEVRSFRDKLAAAFAYTKRDTLAPAGGRPSVGASASSKRQQGR